LVILKSREHYRVKQRAAMRLSVAAHSFGWLTALGIIQARQHQCDEKYFFT